jgi:hypothetical protein
MTGQLLRNLTESRNVATGDLDKRSLRAVTLMWSVVKSQQILDKWLLERMLCFGVLRVDNKRFQSSALPTKPSTL